MLDYLWLIGLTIFLAYKDKEPRTLLFIPCCVIPGYILLNFFPDAFDSSLKQWGLTFSLIIFCFAVQLIAIDK